MRRPLYISEPPDQNTKGVEVMEELAVARFLLFGIYEPENKSIRPKGSIVKYLKKPELFGTSKQTPRYIWRGSQRRGEHK